MDALDKKAKVYGVCAFCIWHGHDFPRDYEHETKHAEGWHSCDVLGGFRMFRPFCPHFKWHPDVYAGS